MRASAQTLTAMLVHSILTGALVGTGSALVLLALAFLLAG